jgi:hypothetical protein
VPTSLNIVFVRPPAAKTSPVAAPSPVILSPPALPPRDPAKVFLYCRCCGFMTFWFGSGSAFKLWIRIQENKNDPQKLKKVQNLHVLSAGCSLWRVEGFSCSLGILYGGLGISKLQFLIKKIKLNSLSTRPATQGSCQGISLQQCCGSMKSWFGIQIGGPYI